MLLFDTHVWWWAINEPKVLSQSAYKLISRTPADQRAIASISIWEFAMMITRKRIRLKISSEEWLDHAINRTGITVLNLTPRIALESCNLPGTFHKDPADRIIVATARIHKLKLITKDQNIIGYPNVETVW
ncbi:MAG: type II toxin-antitoxin system VapC family toxin [Thermodesulfobacteriota bacterium]|nr:type II toxin-antitoxin system VapC family toxin [Thermodesulfobacteriota bacterium]